MKIEANKGMSIYQAAQMAVDHAAKTGAEVELLFNEVTICVSPFSFADDIATIYDLKHKIRFNKSKLSRRYEEVKGTYTTEVIDPMRQAACG